MCLPALSLLKAGLGTCSYSGCSLLRVSRQLGLRLVCFSLRGAMAQGEGGY